MLQTHNEELGGFLDMVDQFSGFFGEDVVCVPFVENIQRVDVKSKIVGYMQKNEDGSFVVGAGSGVIEWKKLDSFKMTVGDKVIAEWQ